MLYTDLGGQKRSGKTPVGPISCQYHGSCLPTRSGSGAVPKLSPYAKSIPKREEASACSLEPKLYLSPHNSSNGWHNLHSYNGGGNFAAERARWSLP